MGRYLHARFILTVLPLAEIFLKFTLSKKLKYMRDWSYFRFLFISVILLAGISRCKQTDAPKEALPVEAGVSERLKEDRAARLSDVKYTLGFTIPDTVSAPIPATETISFQLSDASHALQLDFKEADSAVHDVVVNGTTVGIKFENEHLVIDPVTLETGANTVTIHFTAGNLSLNRSADYLYTLFVPDRARTAFPCFDQPDLKAVFELTLTVPAGWQAVANAPLQDSTAAQGQTVFQFKPSKVLPTYLFSFVAGKFKTAERTLQDHLYHTYYRETDAEKISLSLDKLFSLHADARAFMADYTQIPYPFQKFDFVSIPAFQYGGMEHAGAILYKESALFLDQGATHSQLLSRANVIAHETAHMWFGDLVTMRWFNDVWMKEVFANFMADKVGTITMPDDNYDLKFLHDHFRAAYGVDRTQGANAIRQPLANLNQAGSLYGSIIYHKAPIMMRQLERLMGEEAFRDGLREYLKTYSYGNASWPDLIDILDKRTDTDLKAWNDVWVNQTGRPVFTYAMTEKAGKIEQLTITQTAEQGPARQWPQLFEIALVYADHLEELTINMNDSSVVVADAAGKAVPNYILFNSSGQGYGIFPVEEAVMDQLPKLKSALMRESAYINLYETMLTHPDVITPTRLLAFARDQAGRETEPLNQDVLLSELGSIYWHFLNATTRATLAPALEESIWRAMLSAPTPNAKKQLFNTYASITLSKPAQDRLYKIWQTQQPPAGVTLSEEDYTNLAAGLAIRDYPGYARMLDTQYARIDNPDRRQRFAFVRPALSDTIAVRDAFFASLAKPENREKESWVLRGLSYLHHPLRTSVSENYIPRSLAMIEEIQQTGDIFFPQRWLDATLGNYQSASAAMMVREFLDDHAGLNPQLRAKVLQSADDLFRAVDMKLVPKE